MERLNESLLGGNESPVKNKKILLEIVVVVVVGVVVVVVAAIAFNGRDAKSRELPIGSPDKPCMFGRGEICYNIPKRDNGEGASVPLKASYEGAKQICRFYGERLAGDDDDDDDEDDDNNDVNFRPINGTKGSLWNLLLFELTTMTTTTTTKAKMGGKKEPPPSRHLHPISPCVWIRRKRNKRHHDIFSWDGNKSHYGDEGRSHYEERKNDNRGRKGGKGEGERKENNDDDDDDHDDEDDDVATKLLRKKRFFRPKNRRFRRNCDALIIKDREGKRKTESKFDVEGTTTTTTTTTKISVASSHVETTHGAKIYGARRNRDDDDDDDNDDVPSIGGGRAEIGKRNCERRCLFVCEREA